MKSRVVIMALLCLLLIFTGAMAQTDIPAAPVPVANLVYTGEPQALYSDPGNVGYYWFWDADGTGTPKWSKSIPTAVNAGTYSYGYYLDGVTSSEVKLESVIKQQEVTLIWEGNEEAPEVIEKVYNGQEQRLTAAFPDEFNSGELNCILTVSGKLTNVNQGEGTASADISKTSGSKTLCDQNYNITNRTHKFKITPLAAELKWVNDQFTYDGQPHAPEASVENLVEGDTCTVTVQGEQVNAQTNAYTATATDLSNDNYALPEKNTKKFNINSAELGITWSETTSFEYDGEEHAPEITAITGCAEGEDCSEIIIIEGAETNAGSYEAEATLTENVVNYKFSTETEKTCEFEITKKKVTLLWESLEEAPEVIEKEYNGQEQRLTAAFPDDFNSGKLKCILTVSGKLTNVNQGEGTASAAISRTSGNKELCDQNYNITNRTQKFKITPLGVNISWDESEFTYDGDEHPEATLTGVLDGKDAGLTVDGKEINANSEDEPVYTAKASISNKNYKIVNEEDLEHEFTIAKADPKYVEPEPLDKSALSYTGSNLPLLKSIGSATEPENGRWIFFSTYTDPEGKTGEPQKIISTVPTGNEEGSYTITWYFYNNGNPENYNNGGSPENPLGTATVTIAKDIAEIRTIPAAIEGLEFNGSQQTLITAGTTDQGTFMYFLDGAEEESDQLPQGKDAGDYTVRYYIKGDETHADNGSFENPLEPSINVTIAKKPARVSPAPIPFNDNYDGNEKELLTATGKAIGGTYRFKLDDGEYSEEIPTATNAGEYAITYYVVGDDNHTNSEENTVIAKINKIDPVVKNIPAATNPTYNGQMQKLVTPGEYEGGTILYFLMGDEPSEDVPTATNAGKYPVYYYVVGDENHNDLDVEGTHRYAGVTSTIKPLTVNVIPNADSKVYGAKDPVLTYIFDPDSLKPEVKGNIGRNPGEAVGDYYFNLGDLELDGASIGNFTLAFKKNDLDHVFSITKSADATINAPTANTGLIYSGQAQNLLATLASVEGDESAVIVYKIGSAITEGNPNAKDAGDYEIEYYIKGDKNHEEIHNESWKLTVSIEKATITVTPNSGQTKVVGKGDPLLTWNSTGWKTDQKVLTGALEREEGEAIGKYKITQGSVALGEDVKSNYVIEFIEGVEFEITPSQEEINVTINGNVERQGYTGSQITMEHPFVLAEDTQKGILESDITCTGKVTGTDKGTYTAYLNELGCTIRSTSYPNATLNVPDNAVATLIISEATITEADFIAPTVREGLVFNGNDQNLINPGKWTGMEKGTFVYSITDYTQKAVTVPTTESQEIPQGFDAGNYTVTWRIIGNGNFSDYNPADPELDAEIAQLDLESDEYPVNISIEPAIAPYTEEPNTAVVTITVNGMQLQENRDYEIVNPDALTQTEIGIYTVLIDGVNPNVTGSASVAWEIKDMVNRISMFRIGEPDKVCLRCGVLGGELPATGFPTRVNVPLAVKPQGLDYAELGMRIQIPSLNVDVELAGVPTMDGAWKVEWLADRAGLLSGTALPGDGYSIVAAHNTLNAEEVGPFVLLSALDENDTVFVNAADGSMKLFRVYANELLAPDDMETLASIAEREANTLVLVTCENESVDGGYLNRRVVFAKPLN